MRYLYNSPTVDEAVLAERVHVERNLGAVGAADDLRGEVNLQLAARVAVRRDVAVQVGFEKAKTL